MYQGPLLDGVGSSSPQELRRAKVLISRRHGFTALWVLRVFAPMTPRGKSRDVGRYNMGDLSDYVGTKRIRPEAPDCINRSTHDRRISQKNPGRRLEFLRPMPGLPVGPFGAHFVYSALRWRRP